MIHHLKGWLESPGSGWMCGQDKMQEDRLVRGPVVWTLELIWGGMRLQVAQLLGGQLEPTSGPANAFLALILSFCSLCLETPSPTPSFQWISRNTLCFMTHDWIHPVWGSVERGT